MGFFDILKKIAGPALGVAAAPFTGGASLIPTIAGAAGSALSGAASASASNRNSALEAEMAAEQLSQQRRQQFVNEAQAREADRQSSGSDAWRKLQQAEYVAGAEGYKPKAGLPTYSFGPRASSASEREAAASYAAEARKRLDAKDSLLPTAVDPGRFAFDPKNLKGSTAEKLAGILGTGLSAYGGLANDIAGQETVMEALKRLGIRTATDGSPLPPSAGGGKK